MNFSLSWTKCVIIENFYGKRDGVLFYAHLYARLRSLEKIGGKKKRRAQGNVRGKIGVRSEKIFVMEHEECARTFVRKDDVIHALVTERKHQVM